MRNVYTEEKVKSFSLSGDGKRVLVLTDDHKCIMRNALNGNHILEIDEIGVSRVPLDHTGYLVACGKQDGTIKVWNTEQSSADGNCWNDSDGEANMISLSRNGTRVVSMKYGRAIQVRDTKEEKLICCIDKTVDNTHITDLEFSSDGQLIIGFADFHHRTKIWEVDSQKLIFHDQPGCPESMAMNANFVALRDCGPRACWLWPRSRVRASGHLFIENHNVCYMNGSEKKILASLPASRYYRKWHFSSLQGTFVTTTNRRLAIYRVMT